ncbi:MAG: hypothetical protein QM820_17795 [Minicystis sp.]
MRTGTTSGASRILSGPPTNFGRTNVAACSTGEVAIAGNFKDSIDFGSGPIASKGALDWFVASYDAAGNVHWTKTFGQMGGGVFAKGVAVDPLCNTVLSGTHMGTIDLGGGLLTTTGQAALVAKLDTSGNHLWSRSFGDGSQVSGGPVAAYGQGNTIVSGTFPGEIDFGGGPLMNTGGANVFVAKLLLP